MGKMNQRERERERERRGREYYWYSAGRYTVITWLSIQQKEKIKMEKVEI